MEEDDDIMADSHGTNMAAGHPEHSLHTSPPSMADNQNSSSEKNIPRVGMCFQSEEEAYKFYNLYAESNGFSIRRCHRKYRADGTLSSRYFVCSKSGVKATHPTHVTKKEQPNSRTACMARVQFSITREGIWNVQKVILDYNHQLVSPDKRHMLRSQRQLLDADRHMIKQMRTSGIRQSEIFDFCEQWYGKDGVPFLQMDCNNYLRSERRKYLESNDAQTLMEYLKNKQVEDPSFFYGVQLDEDDGTIMNIFWADGQAIMDYSVFGDAISFDTTFSTNKFKMPFAPLIGVNHHKQTILFGAALLYNESADSFEWLFRTFLQAMSELLPAYDKCTARIRRKEKYEDYKSRHTDPVLCLSNLPLLKTAAESYTRTLYSEFEEEFKKQFSLSCVLLGTEGTISTYKVTSFQYKNDEAIVAFNPSTLDISCSCRLYGCVGILCKHIHKVFTCCNIITLPSHYILNRWTKYAKQEIFTSKLNNNDSLESMFAHTSRKMMSLALKCKSSKEVLRNLSDGIDKLALEAGELLSKVNLDEVEDPESSAESTEEISKTMVPFKVPERVKARMEKRSKDALEGAKKGKKKGKVSNHPAKESVLAPLRVDQQNTSPFLEPETASGPDLQAEWVDNTNPYTTVPFGEYQPAFVPPIHGEFTRLLFGVHGDGTTTAARQLDFGEGASTSGFQQ